MQVKNVIFSFVLVGFIAVSCNSSNTKTTGTAEKKDSTKVENDPKVVVNKELNDIALFIAGMQVDSASNLYKLTQSKEWINYKTDMDAAWKKFFDMAENIKTWKNKEIAKTNDSVNTLFYPFGGPDYLFANIFFPNAKNYVLIGLENAGNPPSKESLSEDSLKDATHLYKSAISDVIQLSFFRTLDMNVELKTKTIDGTTPIIMLFLVRSGKEIVSITPMNLNEQGTLVKAESKKHIAEDIAFVTKGDTAVHHVIYLSTNLADPSLSQDKGFMAFLKNLDSKSYAFVKSATYLMHKGYFSIIRNTVLDKASLLLQDASGIAYKYFDKSKWDIQLFGVYEKPIPLFKDFYEADLETAFQKGSTPITFRYGYNKKSSMLLALKK
jgi:hypothetical protein